MMTCVLLGARGQTGQSNPGELLRAGRFQEALAAIQQALRTHPQDARLLSMQGIAQTQLGDEASALKSYRAALAASPDYLAALEGAAQIEYRNNDSQAGFHIDRLIALNQNDATAHAMRATLKARAGQCEQAVVDFAAGEAIVEQQPEAMRQYAACQFRLGRFEQAVATLKPFPSDSMALALSASALEKLGRIPEAVTYLRNAILADPTRESLYAQFTELCFTYKSFQAGIDVINAGLIQLPRSSKLYVLRGVLLVQQGNYDSADRDFATAESLNPSESVSADAAVLSLVQANKLDEAQLAINQKLKQHPEDPQLLYFLADVLSRQGDNSGSIVAARKAVALRSDFPLAHDLLARLYLQSGNISAAIGECEAALKTDPQDEAALYRWLRILKARHSDGDAEVIRSLTNRWLEAKQKQKDDELRESQFRIITSK